MRKIKTKDNSDALYHLKSGRIVLCPIKEDDNCDVECAWYDYDLATHQHTCQGTIVIGED